MYDFGLQDSFGVSGARKVCNPFRVQARPKPKTLHETTWWQVADDQGRKTQGCRVQGLGQGLASRVSGLKGLRRAQGCGCRGL